MYMAYRNSLGVFVVPNVNHFVVTFTVSSMPCAKVSPQLRILCWLPKDDPLAMHLTLEVRK